MYTVLLQGAQVLLENSRTIRHLDCEALAHGGEASTDLLNGLKIAASRVSDRDKRGEGLRRTYCLTVF
jgi:hypothetical protein